MKRETVEKISEKLNALDAIDLILKEGAVYKTKKKPVYRILAILKKSTDRELVIDKVFFDNLLTKMREDYKVYLKELGYED